MLYSTKKQFLKQLFLSSKKTFLMVCSSSSNRLRLFPTSLRHRYSPFSCAFLIYSVPCSLTLQSTISLSTKPKKATTGAFLTCTTIFCITALTYFQQRTIRCFIQYLLSLALYTFSNNSAKKGVTCSYGLRLLQRYISHHSFRFFKPTDRQDSCFIFTRSPEYALPADSSQFMILRCPNLNPFTPEVCL